MTKRKVAEAFRRSIEKKGAESRVEDDYYRTPPIGTKRLLEKENFRGVVWEPACGDGAISRTMKGSCDRVVSTDLVDRGYGKTGIDFLAHRPRFHFDHVVTNPPFSLTLAFAKRALEIAPKKVALLCRLTWLEGKTRREFFENSPLARVWVFSGRVNVSRDGKDYGDDGEGGMVAYAWYVWQRGHRGPPQLGWI